MRVAAPFVSVLIDTYNHERFIEQAIVSVLEQDYPPGEREVVVVDDGSLDNTPAIVRKFLPSVRYLRKNNGGQAAAFNTAVPELRGEIVAFLDGDDWWAPTKLGEVVKALLQNPDVGLVGHGITEVYPDGRQRTEVIKEIPRFRANSLEGARAFRLRKSFLGTSRMTARRELLQRVLPVPEDLTIEADEYLFTLAALLADVLILPEALTYYRIHGANLFQGSGLTESGLRRKQRVLACLAEKLSVELRVRGLTPPVARTVTEVVQAEADQLRLSLDGGYPWETARTELRIYGIMHGGASKLQRAFKYLSLLPALVLPPAVYYRIKRRVAQDKRYLRARENWIPIPKPGHVERFGLEP
jgi:GT2 family glycosyltransferase